MNCPACQKRACSFRDWMRGATAFAHVCPHCGQLLRAPVRTWLVLVMIFGAIPFLAPVVDRFCHIFGLADPVPRLGGFAIVWMAGAGPLAFLAWRTGTFALPRTTRASGTEPDRPLAIEFGPIRHEKLPDEVEARIRKFENTFAEVYPRTREEWLEGFQRDVDPEPEVAIWEKMASAFQSFTDKHTLTLEAKKEAFGLLLMRSAADEQQTLSGENLRHLSRHDAEELLHSYSSAPQPVIYEQR
jgi:hypothetical protein